MSRARRPAATALLAWTFLVWTTRINNILTDDSLDSGDQAARLVLALTFTAFVAAGAWALGRGAAWLDQAVVALSIWTVFVWVVRAFGIAFADHSAGFVAVHLALAVVSTVLAGLATREARTGTARPARQ